MKYFVIADVHGFYDEMIDALNKAGFDRDNTNHCLISLGDVTDRGTQPLQVIDYLMSLERKILIRGNHEDLVNDLIYGRRLTGADFTNGSFDTVRLIAEREKGYKISETLAQFDWDSVIRYADLSRTWFKYYNSTIDYAEIGNYVFVHGWIPCEKMAEKETPYGFIPVTQAPEYNPNWRKADLDEWVQARWTRGPRAAQLGVFEPNKTIVCGHWMTSDFHKIFDGRDNDFSPYIDKNVIACDGCTAGTGIVNVVVLDI